MRILSFIAAFFCVATALVAAEPVSKVTLERTGCFGTCPAYMVTIHRSGRVVFTGRQHVRAKGVRSGRVSALGFAALVKKVDEINFFTLRDRYDGKNPDGSGVKISDLPTRRTTVTQGSRTKTVENYYRGPAGLKELEDLIDEVGKTARWIGP